MKRPHWLTRPKMVWGWIALSLVALSFGLHWTGIVERGFGPDKTITISETRNRRGNITQTATTTTEQGAKTQWDWLSLLGVPLALAIFGWWLQQLQESRATQQEKLERELSDEKADRDKKIAEDNQRDEVLQYYFDRLSEFLVQKDLIAVATKVQAVRFSAERLGEEREIEIISNISTSSIEETQPSSITLEQQELLNAAKDIIRARTVSILRRLGDDKERKGDVIRFLSETEVIRKLDIDLSNLNLANADLKHIKIIGANLRNTNLAGATLTYAILSHTDLSSTDIRNTKLISADLRGADLTESDLRGADLRGADLTDADLTDADLTNANLSSATLDQANFRGTRLINANLNFANLNFANLTDANLTGANIKNASIRSANLTNANLTNTNLTDANLTDANLIGANLTIALVEQALLCRTTMADGTINNRDCEKLRENYF